MTVGVEDVVMVEDVVCCDEVVKYFFGGHGGALILGDRLTRILGRILDFLQEANRG